MKSRFLHTSYVLNFLDIDFNSNEISDILTMETNIILNDYIFPELEGWELQFKASYGKREPLKIFTKMPSYKKERQKLIIIHIPIPTQNIVSWGVQENQHISIGSNDNRDKNNLLLDVNFDLFSNRQDYIIDCLRRGVRKAFEVGFAVNGVKLKAKKTIS